MVKTQAQFDKPTFEQWMERVDASSFYYAGLSVYDLPDCNFRDWYEDEVSPGRAARMARKAARE